MRLFKFLRKVALLFAACLIVAGFTTPVNASSNNSRTKVVFWYEVTGPAAKELRHLIKRYNHSQSRYYVIGEFQGTYDEAVQKFLNTHDTKASPALFQGADLSTAQLDQSGYTTPIQNFINRDHYPTSNLSKAALSFYSRHGKQLSMPFNVSQPILYYNRSVFEKYGVKSLPVDPTYGQVKAAALQLYRNSHHKVKGISVEPYGWLLEEFYSNANVAFGNNHNGKSGLITHVNLEAPFARQTMSWIQSINKKGAFMNYGTGSNADTNEIAGFLARKVGMFLQSSSQLTQVDQGSHDKIGICYYPHPDDQKPNGVAIGGASLWIGNDKSFHIQKGAWDFTKFLMQPDVQAQWQIKTGYLAVNMKSQQLAVLKRYYNQHPEARVPGEQLAGTKPNDNNSGIYLPNMNQERVDTQSLMSDIYNGDGVSKSLRRTQKDLNKSIATTNRANSGHYQLK